MMSSTKLEFKGYAMTDPKNWHDLKVVEFTPKDFEADDVDIAITHCGVCGSDVHTLRQGWGPSHVPLVVGHEIVGKVVRVGDNVTDTKLKVGSRVGVGAKIGSCMECRECKEGFENYCQKGVNTYNGVYPDKRGTVSHGGYATAIRAHQRFVFPIPDALKSEDAASMLCGGLTVYSPLVTNGCKPGKKVGIVGIGGLGHYAIMFAKALGAEVYAFTHSPEKSEDAKELGADHVIDTNDKDFAKKHQRSLDIIVTTMNASPSLPLKELLSMLYVHGRIVNVGIPDADKPLPQLHAFDLVPNGAYVGGSSIGSKAEAEAMLKLAVQEGVKPWIEELEMKEASKAVQWVHEGKPRYRYVLRQDLVKYD